MRFRVVSAAFLTPKRASSAFGGITHICAVLVSCVSLSLNLNAAAPPKQEVVDPNAPVRLDEQYRAINRGLFFKASYLRRF